MTAHITTPWVEVVIRLDGTVWPGGDNALILRSKTPPEQRNIGITEGLRAKALYHCELTESEHGLTSVPRTGYWRGDRV